MRIAALLILVVLNSLLAGCGFHFRGTDTSGAPAATPLQVRIDDKARNTATGNWLGSGPDELARTLSEVFVGSGMSVRDDAALTVELTSEYVEKRVASVDASAGAAEYQLDYTLLFRVIGNDGATLIDTTRLKADRSYRYKANAIMGSAEEEALLLRDMRRDISTQILRRLRQTTAAAPAAPATATVPPDHAPLP